MSRFDVTGLGFVTVYPLDLGAALGFYGSVFGPPDRDDPLDRVWGWRLGDTWFTLAPNVDGTRPGREPCNVEFAVVVKTSDEVDRLYAALVAAGAQPGREPEDTVMYQPMRYAYVDDPFGVRIDVICLL